MTKTSHTNKLINEKSPYLQQHANDPVDWYPWGDEAFSKAKKEDKAVFLSIGYSTCHWCHVMQEETFSNTDIAGILNKYFVSIKVDREERPDVDSVYMKLGRLLGAAGGWPLNLFLTPEKIPFFSGAYFSPEDMPGKKGFKSVLLEIESLWKDKKEEILRSALDFTKSLNDSSGMMRLGDIVSEDTVHDASNIFLSQYDSKYGGFGDFPKFPEGPALMFLLRFYRRKNSSRVLDIVEKTLSHIRGGGIHDHLGGGFHRCSRDAKWHLPHFEKMLYDQAILAKTYMEAYQLTQKEEYAKTAREILEFVLRDMSHPEGGFYSAVDADSSPDKNSTQKKEGAFYLWEKDEIVNILGKEDAEIFNFLYGIEENGNISQDFQDEFKKKNVLYLKHTINDASDYFKKSPTEIEHTINASRQKLLTARNLRPKPHLDDKILTDLNGLMISALAFGGRILDEPLYLGRAKIAADFILRKMFKNGNLLYHRYRYNEVAIPGFLNDYAFFIQGLLDLYEANFNAFYLNEALSLSYKMIDFFEDKKVGGFFLSSSEKEFVFTRPKIYQDEGLPSGNSVALLDLLRLKFITFNNHFERHLSDLLHSVSADLLKTPRLYAQMLIGIDFAIGPVKEILIVSQDSGDAEIKRMASVIYKAFLPNKVVIYYFVREKGDIVSIAPWIRNVVSPYDRTTAYLCGDYVCELPVNSADKLDAILKEDQIY